MVKMMYTDRQPRGRDQEVRVGDVISFHNADSGETWTVTGLELPRHAGSTGRVYIRSSRGYTGGYYPSVIGAEWRAVCGACGDSKPVDQSCLCFDNGCQ